ncbi:glutaredoxin-C11 [Gossypium australe]|uniref:Glutaredoxin-C11 n=1 Tax=Gossypium australe TaxID=47621 RepID=A0A5B6VPH9_9ROSI|nr:glutaredoxin-C11 [Gossypium australe]
MGCFGNERDISDLESTWVKVSRHLFYELGPWCHPAINAFDHDPAAFLRGRFEGLAKDAISFNVDGSFKQTLIYVKASDSRNDLEKTETQLAYSIGKLFI